MKTFSLGTAVIPNCVMTFEEEKIMHKMFWSTLQILNISSFNLFLYSKDHAAISTNVLPHVQDKILCEFISFCWCAVMFGIISNIPSEESECIFVSSCLLLGTNFHWIWVKGSLLEGRWFVWEKQLFKQNHKICAIAEPCLLYF